MGKRVKHVGISNIDAHRADMERRRSSAASPQESRNKRLRTRQAIVRQELRDSRPAVPLNKFLAAWFGIFGVGAVITLSIFVVSVATAPVDNSPYYVGVNGAYVLTQD